MKCTPAAQAALVEKFMPLCRRIAGRQWHKGIGFRLGSYDDCLQAAVLGLLKAIRYYRPNHTSHAKFITFAFPVIDHYLYRQCHSCGLIAVPFPSAYPEARDRAMNAFAVDGFGRDEEPTREDAAPADFDDMTKCLPARDRLFIRLRFVDEMEQSDIGERFGISKQRVEQIQRRALVKLHAHMRAKRAKVKAA